MPLVYSTGKGEICPGCGKPVDACTCEKQSTVSSTGDGVVRVRREVKGRKGKTVTSISGLALEPDKLRDCATALKRKCGAGGSVKDGIILIQGDHCNTIVEELKKNGFNAKRAGG
ncbi:MAG: translation initiation factor Sui1 [candidate division KSB1 bacterium]|jgi:translation initiation factor 1|nr:translation initiation factor Sui1 [candidate division KSB1 bacterium]